MNELLHTAALAPAAAGAAMMWASRSRGTAPERISVLVMLGGMIDAMTTRLVAPLWWFALLIAGAMTLAAARRRHPLSGRPREAAPLTVHVATGLVVTAGLILLMPSSDLSASAAAVASTATEAPAHAHADLAPTPLVLATALVCGQVLITCVGVRTEQAWLDRAHHLLMACSTVAMGLIIVA